MGAPVAGAPGLRGYLAVTAAYWGFTLTDGALRMLVLLHFWRLGYDPLSLSLLFLLYEAAGIVANLAGGWLAVRFGIARMLAVGLAAQIAGFLLLSALSAGWSAAASVLWVVVAQGICGVAKDITKTASKSAIKLTAGDGAGRLFRWVAWFTGSKNAMKGLGFFLGGLLLELLGFRAALWAMAGALALVLLGVVATLPAMMGRGRPSRDARALLAKSRSVNLLALARVFLFAARDAWFVVGVPVHFYAAGWSVTAVGTFMALWTIGYGLVQALTPSLVARSSDGLAREVSAARLWALLLAAATLLLAGAVAQPGSASAAILVGGLALFGIGFALNSSIHSYLILAYAGSKKAAEDVGFYYAANAAGRFAGTLLSGLLFAAGGVALCLAASGVLLLASWLVTLALPASRAAPGTEIARTR